MNKVSYKNGIKDFCLKPEETKTLDDIFYLIKNNPRKTTIEACRTIGKHIIGDDGTYILNEKGKKFIANKEYEVLKNTLSVFFPSGVFGYKAEEKNLNELSGYVYIDIDGLYESQMVEVAEVLKNTSFVYAFWRSVSNIGYGILAKIEDLTIDNYINSINYCQSIINLPFDSGAKKITQPCFISLDPNMYVNEHCISLSVPVSFGVNKEKTKKETKKETLGYPIERRKEEESYYQAKVSFLNEKIKKQTGAKRIYHKTYFDEEFYNNQKEAYIKDGFCQIEIKKNPNKKIQKGHRTSEILIMSNKLLLINMDITKSELIKEVNKLNFNYCIEPLELKQIENIVMSSFKYFFDNKLYCKPITKYVSFNPYLFSEISYKQSKGAKIGAERKKDKNIKKIKIGIKSIEEEGRTATQKEVAERISMSLKTVNRRWNEL